jgi:hypothetical protein
MFLAHGKPLICPPRDGKTKGHWHQGYDCTFVTEDEKNGRGCQRDCAAVVKEYGAKEWWVKLATAEGKTGWVLADGNFDGMDSLAFLSPVQPSFISPW